MIADAGPIQPSLRVALCGYGFAGRTFHAPLITATPGLTLTVVASTRPDAVAADLPDVEVVPTAEAAMAGADLVVLAGPHHTHAPLAHAALARGRHVVVDKPLSLSLAEARAVAADAAAAGRVLAVFHNRRWDNDFLALASLAHEGTIGDIVHVESRFDRFRPQVRPRWREQKGPGGGLWHDLGPHLVDQALQLFGVPDRLGATLARQRPGAETDDWAHVVLSFGERRMILHASLVAAAASPRFVAHGTTGSWVKHGLDVQERQLLEGRQPGGTGWGEDPRPATLTGEDGQAVEVPLPPGAWQRFYPAVREAIRGAGPPPVPVLQAVAVIAVMDAVFTSAATGAVVGIPLTPAERTAVADGAVVRP